MGNVVGGSLTRRRATERNKTGNFETGGTKISSGVGAIMPRTENVAAGSRTPTKGAPRVIVASGVAAHEHDDRVRHVTHGFWLQQYLGLHNDAGPGTPRSQSRACERNSRSKSRTTAGATATTRRQRFLARWTGFGSRNFGGSTGEVLQQSPAADSSFLSRPSTASERLGASSAPPFSPERASAPVAEPALRRPARGGARKRARTSDQQQLHFGCQICGTGAASSSLSSTISRPAAPSPSSSAGSFPSASLEHTAASGLKTTPSDRPPAQRRLGDWLFRSVSSSTSALLGGGTGSNDRKPGGISGGNHKEAAEAANEESSSRRSSPYKQIARLWTRRTAQMRPLPGASEQQVGRTLFGNLFASPSRAAPADTADGARRSQVASGQDGRRAADMQTGSGRRRRKTSAKLTSARGDKNMEAGEIRGAECGDVTPELEGGRRAAVAASSPSLWASSCSRSRPLSPTSQSPVATAKQTAKRRQRVADEGEEENKDATPMRMLAGHDEIERAEVARPSTLNSDADEPNDGGGDKNQSDASESSDAPAAVGTRARTRSFRRRSKRRRAPQSPPLTTPARHVSPDGRQLSAASQQSGGQRRASPPQLPDTKAGQLAGASTASPARTRSFRRRSKRRRAPQSPPLTTPARHVSPDGRQLSAASQQSGGQRRASPPQLPDTKAGQLAGASTASPLPLVEPATPLSFASVSLGCDAESGPQPGEVLSLITTVSTATTPEQSDADADYENNADDDDMDDDDETAPATTKLSAKNDDERWTCAPPAERPTSQPVGAAAAAAADLKRHFKKFVKRQQSVDSYRMARDMKQKMRRQLEGGHNKHLSNEAIKPTRSVGDETPASVSARQQRFPLRSANSTVPNGADEELSDSGPAGAAGARARSRVRLKVQDEEWTSERVEICVDPYAMPGSFVLPGEQPRDSDTKKTRETHAAAPPKVQRVPPTPPNTLSLMPSGATGHKAGGTTGSLLMGSGFSGSITPTYPTHHLPSPKYVSPAALMVMQKKYSNASTISSNLSMGGPCGGSVGGSASAQVGGEALENGALIANGQPNQSGGGGASEGSGANQAHASDTESSFSQSGRASKTAGADLGQEALARDEAAAALRRANMAEHIYDNKCGLGEDMKFLASLPELCDITFLVGETREPVCAVKSVLAARSRVFHKILFGDRLRAAAAAAAAAAATEAARADEQAGAEPASPAHDRRGSSPRPVQGAGRALANLTKSSLSSSRSTSPQTQQQQQQQHQQQSWSVTSDASGLAVARAPAPPARADSTTSTSGRARTGPNGREPGAPRASQSGQQPLIIGPGQTATPAPKQHGHKKARGHLRDSSNLERNSSQALSRNNRLSRMFSNKRASDPSLKNNQPVGGQARAGLDSLHQNSTSGLSAANQNYLDKMSSSQKSTTMIIEEFEPDVFRQLIEYIHTGCVLLQARTLLGLLNAADYYGLEQLRKACLRFVSCCITVDTVCSLLSTAERYIQYKCTKSIVQKVLEFVDSHANEIFKLNAFGLLPEHVVRLILARDGLQADEQVKYEGVYTWCEHYCRSYELTNIAHVMRNFLNLIQFHKIPTQVLLSEIYPTHIVPDEIFLTALAYQADPGAFEQPADRPRRMTLPSSIMFRDYDDDAVVASNSQQPKRQSSAASGAQRRDSNTTSIGSGQQQRPLLGARKSTGGSIAPAPKQKSSSKAGRKGSFAQQSISGAMRLSHKLSIRRKSPSAASSSGDARRRGSGGASGPTISKQSSLAQSVAGATVGERDPLRLGKQILDTYLLEERQRELEDEERRRRDEAEQRAAEETRRRAEGLEPLPAAPKRPLVKTPSSTRKSFRDFKHISRRLFMRHSSSRTILQSQNSTTSSTGGGAAVEAAAGERKSAPVERATPTVGPTSSTDRSATGRRLLKIKRSETVFETTAAAPSGRI